MDKNENMVQTRGRHTSEWGKKGMERVSSDAKKGKQSTKYDIFHKLLRSDFFKAVSKQLLINNNNRT